MSQSSRDAVEHGREQEKVAMKLYETIHKASAARCSTEEKAPEEVPVYYYEGSPPSMFGVQSHMPTTEVPEKDAYIDIYDGLDPATFSLHKSQSMTFGNRSVTLELENAPLRTLLTNRVINNRVLVLSEREFCSGAFIGKHCVGRGYGELMGFFVGTRISVITKDEERIAQLGMKPYYAILMVPSYSPCLEAMNLHVNIAASRMKLSPAQFADFKNTMQFAYEDCGRRMPPYASHVYNTLMAAARTYDIYADVQHDAIYAWSLSMLTRDRVQLCALVKLLILWRHFSKSLLEILGIAGIPAPCPRNSKSKICSFPWTMFVDQPSEVAMNSWMYRCGRFTQFEMLKHKNSCVCCQLNDAYNFLRTMSP